MFKNVNDEIENCTGNYNKANGISKFDHSYLISMRTQQSALTWLRYS